MTNANIGRRIAMLIGGIALLSLAGSGLLMLRAASYESQGPLYYIDALFVAASAVCATALPLKNIGATFTPFGQTVILGLIQAGGLAMMLLGTVLALRIGERLSAPAPTDLSHPPADQDNGQISRTITAVVVVTFAVELLGAAMLYPMFAQLPGTSLSVAEAAWYSVFHSVSAFCNAGFTLYGDNMMHGVQEGWSRPLREHWQVMGVMAPLIVLGGLGFPVLQDCARAIKNAIGRLRGHSGGPQAASAPLGLTLHSRLVLTATVAMIVLGASGLMLIERPVSVNQRVSGAFGAPIRGLVERTENDWVVLGAGGRVRESFFQSVSARSGGFNTIDLGRLSNAGKLWMSGLMVVGASPGGTGGGLKTVTLAILLLTAASTLRRRDEVQALGRRLSSDLLRRTMTLAITYLALVGLVTLVVTLTMDPRESFIDILLESCSACGSVGMSAGLTTKLTDPAKVSILLGMILGRMAPVATALAMTARTSRVRDSYPAQDVILG